MKELSGRGVWLKSGVGKGVPARLLNVRQLLRRRNNRGAAATIFN
jgi:hypothetical protein